MVTGFHFDAWWRSMRRRNGSLLVQTTACLLSGDKPLLESLMSLSIGLSGSILKRWVIIGSGNEFPPVLWKAIVWNTDDNFLFFSGSVLIKYQCKETSLSSFSSKLQNSVEWIFTGWHIRAWWGNMRRCTGSAFVLAMACHPSGDKPLPESLLKFFQPDF